MGQGLLGLHIIFATARRRSRLEIPLPSFLSSVLKMSQIERSVSPLDALITTTVVRSKSASSEKKE